VGLEKSKSWEQATTEGGAAVMHDDYVSSLQCSELVALTKMTMKEWERKLKVRTMTAIQRTVGEILLAQGHCDGCASWRIFGPLYWFSYEKCEGVRIRNSVRRKIKKAKLDGSVVDCYVNKKEDKVKLGYCRRYLVQSSTLSVVSQGRRRRRRRRKKKVLGGRTADVSKFSLGSAAPLDTTRRLFPSLPFLEKDFFETCAHCAQT